MGHKAGHKADPWRTKFGDAAIADPWQTQGRHKADKADSRRTRGGHMADTRRTSSGDAVRAYRGQPFFLRENPTVNCLGKNIKIGPPKRKTRSLDTKKRRFLGMKTMKTFVFHGLLGHWPVNRRT